MKGNVIKFSKITATAMAGLLYAGSAFSQPEPAAVLAAPVDLLGSTTPRLFIDDLSESNLELPFVNLNGGWGMQSQGIDLSASYIWDSPRFGQFIVSTKATYVYDLNNKELLREASLTPLNATPGMNLNADLQTSLTLTWQIGKHTASAVTHYAGLSEDISSIDMEAFNEMVGNLTTLDLQYGYTLKAGRQGNAVISVGLRSVLDKREGRLLFDAGTLGGERSDHMAYGSIKYQF